MPSVTNSDRVVLDGRLDGGQLWLLTDPDDLLRLPHTEDLAEILGPGRPSRAPVVLGRPDRLRAQMGRGGRRGRVTPRPHRHRMARHPGARGNCSSSSSRSGASWPTAQVLPGPLPNFATAWIAAPGRDAVHDLADALRAAQEHHPDADELCGYLIHTLSVAALGPVPAPLLGRRPSATFSRWVDRVIARRAADARLVLRLEAGVDGFELVPCIEARRVTTSMIELGDVETDRTHTRPVGRHARPSSSTPNGPRRVKPGPRLRDHDPVRRELAIEDVVKLVETAAPKLTAAGIATMLPAHLGQRHTSRRRYRVRGQPASLDVANLILTGEVRVGDTTLTQAELDALLQRAARPRLARGPLDLPRRR